MLGFFGPATVSGAQGKYPPHVPGRYGANLADNVLKVVENPTFKTLSSLATATCRYTPEQRFGQPEQYDDLFGFSEEIISRFDHNRSGMLEEAEFKGMMEGSVNRLLQHLGPLKLLVKPFLSQLTPENLDRFYKVMDRDRQGIDLVELTAGMLVLDDAGNAFSQGLQAAAKSSSEQRQAAEYGRTIQRKHPSRYDGQVTFDERLAALQGYQINAEALGAAMDQTIQTHQLHQREAQYRQKTP